MNKDVLRAAGDLDLHCSHKRAEMVSKDHIPSEKTAKISVTQYVGRRGMGKVEPTRN